MFSRVLKRSMKKQPLPYGAQTFICQLIYSILWLNGLLTNPDRVKNYSWGSNLLLYYSFYTYISFVALTISNLRIAYSRKNGWYLQSVDSDDFERIK